MNSDGHAIIAAFIPPSPWQAGGPGATQYCNVTGLTPGAAYAFELLSRSGAGTLATLGGPSAPPAAPALATPLQVRAGRAGPAVDEARHRQGQRGRRGRVLPCRDKPQHVSREAVKIAAQL
jgi:hypothetical protein